MATPICTIDETGIHVPTFETILTWYQDQYRAIYGADVVLDSDTQDGEWIGIQAAVLNDVNALVVAVYNAFSPSTAQGVGLSRNIKINGISRAIATYSAVDLLLVGVAGTTITNGFASDAQNVRWALPTAVTIPPEGETTVTALATTVGAVPAPAGSITTIATPTFGWQSVTNPLPAVEGAAVESDAALRRRQKVSTAIPSRTVLEGTIGAVAALDGVTRYASYENDTDITDANGIPSHSIALVVEGGDAQAIADAIFAKKGPGAGTYGTTAEAVSDDYGVSRTVRFFRPTTVPISYAVTIRPLPGFTAAIGRQIKQAIADWTNALAIGADVLVTRVYVPANLGGGAASATYEVLGLGQARDSGTPAMADIAIAFNEAAASSADSVNLTIVS